MNLIASADNNWAIGCNGQLLVHIPQDMKHFKALTTGKVIVYGRKTLDTFPRGEVLPNRTNIILTHADGLAVKNAVIAHSMEETLKLLEAYNTDDIFIIGGESIYKQFIGYIDTAYITKIDYTYAADAHMPNLDNEGFKLVEESDEQTCFDIVYTFCTYKKKQ